MQAGRQRSQGLVTVVVEREGPPDPPATPVLHPRAASGVLSAGYISFNRHTIPCD